MRNEGRPTRFHAPAARTGPLALLLALLVTVTGVAAGAGDGPLRVSADAPATLGGEVVARGSDLSLVLTHPGGDGVPGLALEAKFANAFLTYYEHTSLCAPGGACQSLGPADRSDRVMSGGTLRASGRDASPALVVLSTIDSVTPGWPTQSGSRAGSGVSWTDDALAVIARDGAVLGGLDEDLEVVARSPSSLDDVKSRPFAEFDAGTPLLRLHAPDVAGSGLFRIALFGVRVDADGLAPDRTASTTATWTTGFRNETGGGPNGALGHHRFSYLIVEGQAILTVTTAMDGAVYAPPLGATYEAAEGLALDNAEGTVPSERGTLEADGDTHVPDHVIFLAEDFDVGEQRLDLRFLAAGASDTLETADTAPYAGEPRDQTLGVAASAAAAGSLFAVAFYWPFLRHAIGSPIVAAFYTRIGRDEVLEHGKREEIYELIRANPGIHAHDVSARAGIGWGTTVYHLKLLEDNRLVVSRRLGRYKRFYLNAGHITQNKDAYAVLRNETGAALARAVRAAPGVIQKDLCASLGITPSLVSWHMDKLEGAGLVKKVKEGRVVRYYAGPAWEGLDAPVEGNT